MVHINLNEIIGKFSGEVEEIPNCLEWEEREFLEKHSQKALPRLFDVIKTIDTSDYAGYDMASQIFRVTKDVCSRAENFQIAEYLKSCGGQTKGQLKKLSHEAFDSTEKEIVNSILEYLITKIRNSGTEFTLLEGGVKRGKRFALLTR